MNQKSQNAIKAFIQEYREELQFVVEAAAIFAILQYVYFAFFVESSLFYAYLEQCAQLAKWLLDAIGEEVILIERTLNSPAGPSVTVVEGCDAIRIFCVLIAVMLVYRSSWPQKIVGIVLGISFMFVLNIFRIAALLVIDIYITDFFDTFHHVLLPFGLWAAAMLYFYFWARRVS